MQTKERTEVIQSIRPAEKHVVAPYPFSMRMLRFGFATLGRLFPKPASKLAFRLFTTPRKRAQHKTTDAILEKASVFEFLYGQQMLKGYQWGTGERTVLLVHGWESRGTALRAFVPLLLEKGFKVVAFDAPAHGDSGFKQTTLPHFSGAVRAIINRLDGVYGIIGHSFGGATTVFSMAVMDTAIQVERLVLVATPSNYRAMFQQFLNAINASSSVTRLFHDKISSILNFPFEEANVDKLFPRDRVGELLVVHDRNDPIVPFSQGEKIANSKPNSRLLISEGWGHFALMKNQEVIEKVSEFIAAPKAVFLGR